MNATGRAAKKPISSRPVRKSAPVEEALLARLERYRLLVEHLPAGVYRTTPEGRFVEANPTLVRMLGAGSAAGLFRHNVTDLYVEKKDRDEHLAKLTAEPTYFTEFELRALDGRRFWVRDYCRAVKGPDEKLLHFDGILVDISERKKTERQLALALKRLRRSNRSLESLSLTDELTGLNNRRGFFTLGQQQMKIAERLKKRIFIIYFDLDGLKRINDAGGHAAGDSVLADVGAVLRATVRESDVVGRLGGDEFAILAIRSGKGGHRALLRRLEGRFRTRNAELPDRPPLSVSMGAVGGSPQEFAGLEDLLARADSLMYSAKKGKTRARP